jgi:hypothetical protein
VVCPTTGFFFAIKKARLSLVVDSGNHARESMVELLLRLRFTTTVLRSAFF